MALVSPDNTLRIARREGSHVERMAAWLGVRTETWVWAANACSSASSSAGGTSLRADKARVLRCRRSAAPAEARCAARARTSARSAPNGDSMIASTVTNGFIGVSVAATVGSGTTRYGTESPRSAASHGPLIANAALPERNRLLTNAPSASRGSTPASSSSTTSSSDASASGPTNPNAPSSVSMRPPNACRIGACA